MKKQTRNLLIASIFICLLVGTFAATYIASYTSGAFDIKKPVYLYIDKDKDYQSILLQLDTTAHIRDLQKFKTVAAYYKYTDNIKTGRYKIAPDASVLDVVRMLKSGKQAPVSLKFNNVRTKKDLAERISSQLMISESELLGVLNDSIACSNYGFTTDNIGSMFIPNTYEVYWDVKLDKFLAKMQNESKKFWTAERLDKAKKEGLTPLEVSVLASIVEEECFFTDEYPVVAGLYLNRFKMGMLLQADPTIKFAVNDFSIKRVLNRHKVMAASSPYSTYEYVGLPPGPIRIPSIKGLDAVLNPAVHEYLFMCAKDDFSGRHNFARTNAEHDQNAKKYHIALNQRKIF